MTIFWVKSSIILRKLAQTIVKFMATKKGMTTIFFPLSFVAVFGSGIRDKHPGSATLLQVYTLIFYSSTKGVGPDES